MRIPGKYAVPTLALVLVLAVSIQCTDDVAEQIVGSMEAQPADARPRPSILEQRAAALKADLAGRGYDVVEGYWTLFTVDDCKYPIRTVGNCYGNNPAAPYILPAVPRWKDEFVDRKLHHAVQALTRNASATYRLDEREAVVVLGIMPPPGAYFGIQTYVYSRAGMIDEEDEIYRRIEGNEDVRNLLFTYSPNPARVLVFASIGNSLNNVVVERESGSSFEQERSFVITANAAMEEEVADALLRVGVPDRHHIFVEPVSTEVVRVGLGADADDLITLFRYAMPADPFAGARWRELLPLAVLRVRDPNTARPARPYARPDYDLRSANSEHYLAPSLGTLVHAVKKHWGQGLATQAPFISAFSAVDLVGQHCLERPMNCLGDSQDTDTYRISPAFSIEEGRVIAVVGTLGTATGNATYVSLGVNRSAVLTGVANLSDEELDGTATPFAGEVANAEKLYVHYFARDCALLNPCLHLPEAVVPSGEPIKIIQRNYILPGTARGADATQLLSPVAIVLDGTRRPE